MISEYDKASDIERERCIIHDVNKKYYCLDCVKFICLLCGQTTHTGHVWKEIGDILKALEKMKQDVGDVRVHNTAHLQENKDRLERKRLSLKSNIDVLVDNTKNKYERDITQVYQQRLTTLEDDIERDISSLKLYMSHPEVFNTQGLTLTEHALAEKIKDVFDRSSIETMKDTAMLFAADDSQVEESVKLMVGTMIDFQKTETILLSDFAMKNITQIVAVSEHLAWVGSSGEKEVKLININGTMLKTCKLAFALETFAICKADQLLVTSLSNMSIQQIGIPRSKKIQLTTFPTFACMTKSSELLVTSLTDLKNPTGKILKGPYDSFRNLSEIGTGRKNLTCPLKVDENNNGDLCILNKTSNTSNKTELVLLKKDGSMSTLFEDDNDAVEISDIAFDKYGNIISSESKRNAISLIFWNGEKFEKSDICQRDAPIAIARHGNYTWSSSETGNIQVHLLKYHFVCVD
ncbi:hypothetical protein FSP39_011678 [Pinctada imbricata]|uniref:B box-type domain-containing protein n=1 Tax=Pinctada imbricata TaxID=66713 RepID=A0AA89C1G8_PINIB|nr:hypothetical protein FSP39_011678 [Pinctada imbricata]